MTAYQAAGHRETSGGHQAWRHEKITRHWRQHHAQARISNNSVSNALYILRVAPAKSENRNGCKKQRVVHIFESADGGDGANARGSDGAYRKNGSARRKSVESNRNIKRKI
jgi:hypothetical protein